MTDANGLDAVLANAWVDDEVFALRPDYRAVLLAVDGLESGPSDAGDANLFRRRKTLLARRFPVRRWNSCPTSQRGGRRTVLSGRSRNARGTASRR